MKKISRNIVRKLKVLLLMAVAGIADIFRISKRFRSDTPQNCLVISTTGIGDTMWGTPAIRTLKEKNPRLHLSVLANMNGAEIFKGNPFIDKVFIFKKGILNNLSLLRELRDICFDTVVVFHATDRIIWLMAYLTGADRIIGSKRHSKETDFFITHPVNIPVYTHAIRARHMLIKDLCTDSGSNSIEMFVTDRERKEIDTLYRKLGMNKDSLIVGFHPGAAKPYKRWPGENFIKLGKMLSGAGPDIRIVITGNSKEGHLSRKIADEIDGTSLAGRLSLRETAAAIERCGLFITNDTGPMHIAVAVGTPTVALFSATGLENIEPYSSIGSFTVISKPKPCEECISKACTNSVCMEQITPEEVYKAVIEQLSGRES